MELPAEQIKLTQYSRGAGCGCKIAPAVLEEILSTDKPQQFKGLLVGNSSNDDAAAYDLGNGTALISTTDFFMPIVDDAFDFGRIAAANAVFGVPIARTLGNCLSMSNLSRLSALIGAARTKELIFTAKLVGAHDAQAIGLVSEVLPDADTLAARAAELAQMVAGFAPLTLRATKTALLRLREATGLPEDQDLIRMCYESADFREGLEAFLGKRKAEWRGV